MLRRLRRRSLAALREELEPVPPAALAAFLPQWQHVGAPRPAPVGGAPAASGGPSHALRGIDGLARAIEQLQGAPVPASALEKLVLPSRVGGYTPALLDELTATGEVVWAARAPSPGRTAGSPSISPTPRHCCSHRRSRWNSPRCTSRC